MDNANMFLERLVSPWMSSLDYRRQDGALFVRPTLSVGEDAFLHELYAPASDASLRELRSALGYEFSEHARILASHNGASLFNGCVAIYGVVEGVVRTSSLESAQAISLTDELLFFRCLEPQAWADGWRRIGGIALSSRWVILIGQDERVRISPHDAFTRGADFGGVEEALDWVAEVMSGFFDLEGERSCEWGEIETRVAERIDSRSAR